VFDRPTWARQITGSPVRCATFVVLHARESAVAPFEEGRMLAGLIPGARFVALESRNHLLLEASQHSRSWHGRLRSFSPMRAAESLASDQSRRSARGPLQPRAATVCP
jgi:hypothetical protein